MLIDCVCSVLLLIFIAALDIQRSGAADASIVCTSMVVAAFACMQGPLMLYALS